MIMTWTLILARDKFNLWKIAFCQSIPMSTGALRHLCVTCIWDIYAFMKSKSSYTSLIGIKLRSCVYSRGVIQSDILDGIYWKLSETETRNLVSVKVSISKFSIKLKSNLNRDMVFVITVIQVNKKYCTFEQSR